LENANSDTSKTRQDLRKLVADATKKIAPTIEDFKPLKNSVRLEISRGMYNQEVVDHFTIISGRKK
jgi:hypothetical protein